MQERLSSVDTGRSVGSSSGPMDASLTPGRSVRSVTPGPGAKFVAATEWLDDGTPVVSVMGELDLSTAPSLDRTLLDLADEGAAAPIVDFSRCDFIDSAGLKVLAAADKRLDESDRRRLGVVLANASVLRIFEITHFDEVLAIYPSVDLALEGKNNG